MSARCAPTGVALGLALIVLLALGVHGFAVRHWNFLCDDAFISFRYAKNLATGAGLCFNPGVEPPVEGYSNLLWVLICAGFEVLGVAPATGSRVVSAAASAIVLLVLARVVLRATRSAELHGGQRLPALFAVLALPALHPGFAVWSTSGLETMAISLSLLLGFERLAPGADAHRPRDAWLAGAALGAAGLLRADGAALAGLVLAGAWLAARVAASPAGTRAAWRAGSVLALVVAANLVWRRIYHGDWVPNTAHAKVSFSGHAFLRGGLYVGYFLLLYPALVAGALLALLRRPDRLTPLAVAALVPLLGTHVWYLLMGGDYMAFGRLLVPAIPFAAVALAVGVTRPGAPQVGEEGAGVAGVAKSSGVSALRAVVAGLAVLATALPHLGQSALPHAWLARLDFRFDDRRRTEAEAWNGLVLGVERGTLVGRALARYAQPEDSLVAGAVGAKAYYGGMFIYDRHGLVTRTVAQRGRREQKRKAGHARSVRTEFFLPLAPTILDAVVLPVGAPGLLEVPEGASADYVTRRLRLEPGEGIPRGWRLEAVVRRGSRLAGELSRR